jgi:GNAT superfamily N-acetyltransferase
MSAVIRDARSGDGDGIARAWLSAGEYYADLDPEHFQVPESQGLAELFEKGMGGGGDDALELVAELDGRVVGWLFARLEWPNENAVSQFVREQSWTRVVVDALVVDRPVWRRGVGTALLGAAEAWARDRGAEVVRLDTYPESPVSVPFYERMGYAWRSIVFQKHLLDG